MTNTFLSRPFFVFCFFVAGSLGLPFASAQDNPDVKEIISKHIKALGGADKLKSVKTVSAKGVMTMPGPAGEMEAEMEHYQSGPKFLMVMNIPNMGEFRQGSDGKHYWSNDPFSGARLLEGDQLAAVSQQHSQPFPALGWSEYDGELTVDGEADVDGKKCWKVIFKPKTGSPMTRYFDKDSGHVVKLDIKQTGPGVEMEVEVFSEDIKQVNGISVPYKQITSAPQGEMTLEFSEIKFNEKLPDEKFALPEDIQKLVDEKK